MLLTSAPFAARGLEINICAGYRFLQVVDWDSKPNEAVNECPESFTFSVL